MRIGVLGRTDWLIRSAALLADAGHEITFVQTCAAEAYYGSTAEDFERFAAEHGAIFIQEPNVRKSLSTWTETRTDVCISLNWPSLIGAAALSAFPGGILNAHAGDLPRYRGNACPNWAILNFESVVGLSIHRMTERLDDGPCLYKAYFPLSEATYIGEVYDWLADAIPPAFAAAIDRLSCPDLLESEPARRPLRAFPRRPDDSRIDWKSTTRDILALIRASSRPFDGSFTTLENREEIRIFRASAYHPDFDFLAIPGQVCLAENGNPVIATGDGMIEIEDCASVRGASAETKRLILASLRHRLV